MKRQVTLKNSKQTCVSSLLMKHNCKCVSELRVLFDWPGKGKDCHGEKTEKAATKKMHISGVVLLYLLSCPAVLGLKTYSLVCNASR